MIVADARLLRLSAQFLVKNYDYLWLKTMLHKARTDTSPNPTLITGSSHALNGVQEDQWDNAVNCSMHSQDLYYDLLCVREALRSGRQFSRCIIILGYYIAFQDLSRSMALRKGVISHVYLPIFHDARHWEDPEPSDPWAGFPRQPPAVRTACERAASAQILEYGTYYSPARPRGTFFDFHGRAWHELPEQEQLFFAESRADSHNKSFRYAESLRENAAVLIEYICLLREHGCTPIVVIPPFTRAYNRFVLPGLKEALTAMLDSVPDDFHFADFNDHLDLFCDADFMDTDHMSAQGAKKLSALLAEMFGR